MNSNLDKRVKNMWDKDFKYLLEEFVFENLEQLKEKDAYPYTYLGSFKRFNDEKLPARKHFFNSTKKGIIGDDGKISNSPIMLKIIWHAKKFGINLKLKYGWLSRSLF